MSKQWQNGLMLLAVILLIAYPLLTVRVPDPGSEGETAEIFTGADGQAEGVIREIAPDYRPWAEPLMVPPSGEIESLLFALQAVLGAGFIGYYVGVRRERSRWNRDSGSSGAA
ncbi:MAG: cobalt ABC transporter substrate-binding protein CbiN [Desulfuromonadaceae bacterium GWC2_58_13]|nr:MAG: cobalt ABC transporter substrate-binding protein CbiN [Desulfuromonadaceae bacterium GWC2_58_13]